MAGAGQRSSSFSSTLIDVFGFDASERRANVRSRFYVRDPFGRLVNILSHGDK
jgi:hypothetical protein